MPPQSDPDKYGQITIKLTFSVGVSLVIISLGLTILHGFLMKKEHRETLTFMATALATSAAGASAVYALRSVKQDREQREADIKQLAESQLLDRTLPYISRWNEPGFLPFRQKAQELYHLKNSQSINNQEKFIINYLSDPANNDTKQAIINLLNFLEELAVCIKLGLIKEDVIKKFYKGIVILYADTFYTLIKERRKEKGREEIFICLTDLCEKWKKK
ncbi:MAG: DUF4760 domain-containing protein [Symploca sp. SIO3E6]|nr:DUF4760 domain-containing protein [Caldora sp. SIO3E6]